MNEHKKYTIKRVADFASIPAARIDTCLQDFKQMILIMKSINRFGGLGEDVNWCDPNTEFVWTDDGVNGLTEVDLKLIIKRKENER